MRETGPGAGWRGLAAGVRLLRAAAAQGRPAPAPTDLLPLAARLGAQGLLNAQFLAAHSDWLVPAWMREQDDPAAPGFRPRAQSLLDINITARNWTAIGLPGRPAEAIVDPRGLITPHYGGPSLDCWMQAAGEPLLAAATQPVSAIRQRMQGRLPVVATGFEVRTLRLATEAWVCTLGAGREAEAWVAVEAVVFNLSDDLARGRFYFALRPFNPEGVAPITRLAYIDQAFVADGRLAAVFLPAPRAWDCDPGLVADLAHRLPALAGRRAAANPAGLCHGVAAYDYHIAPWEEAEFLAFLPLGRVVSGQWPVVSGERSAVSRQASGQRSVVSGQRVADRGVDAQVGGAAPEPVSYALLKGRMTRAWQAKLDAGLTLRLPDARLEESWTVNVGHLLVLHDGDSITPGPGLYHQFWMRDAAYMLDALATCGYGREAWQVLVRYPARQAADGRFAGPRGEGDAPGAALWTIDRVARLAPDRSLLARLWPHMRRGAGWIARARAGPRPREAAGLLPASRGANHFGPAGYYFWDDLWALAGLEATTAVAARLGLPAEADAWQTEAADLRAALDHSLARALLPDGAIPAAPGRRADSAMIGGLVAWAPLALYPPGDPRLAATLAALQATSSYQGIFFERTVHHGWGTYLNMRIARCLLRRRSPDAFALVTWLLNHATGTFTWPEAINPRTGGGSMGDGHHGWAAAEWLLLLRELLLFEEGDRLVLLAGLPAAWLERAGAVEAPAAPTVWGPLTLRASWSSDGTLMLTVTGAPGPPGGYEVCLPRPVRAATLDGAPLSAGPYLRLPPGDHTLAVRLG
jgi:hypothetical protein